jgi:hypothetical protein
MLPEHPLFNIILATPPPDFKNKQANSSVPINFIRDCESGIFRSATPEELEDYLYGGEYDQIMGDEEDEQEDWG